MITSYATRKANILALLMLLVIGLPNKTYAQADPQDGRSAWQEDSIQLRETLALWSNTTGKSTQQNNTVKPLEQLDARTDLLCQIIMERFADSLYQQGGAVYDN